MTKVPTRARWAVLPRTVFVLPFVFLIIAIASTAYFLMVAAERENDNARSISMHLAQTAFNGVAHDTADWVRDYAWWDETLAQARNGIDEDWAKDNIGDYLRDTFGITGSMVLDPSLRTVYASVGDESLPADATALLGRQSDAFLRRVQNSDMDQSEAFTTYAVADNLAYLVAAAPITAEHPVAADLVPHPRPILILFRALDEAMIRDIAERFLLNDLAIGITKAPNTTTLSLSDNRGAPVAFVSWTPEKPGNSLIRELLPRIAFSVALLVLGAFAVFYFSWHSANAANKAKSDFLAKVSHELRTPLNPIVGFSEAMSLEAFGPLSDTYKGYAEDILQSGRHLAILIDDMLDVSRIEAGKLTIRDAAVDLAHTIKTLPPMEQLLGAAGADTRAIGPVRIQLMLDPDVPMVRADEFRVRQVIVNMIINAARHSHTKDIFVRLREHSGCVQVIVEDHGQGISPENLRKLFSPFTQLGDPLHRKGVIGAGLGLSLSRELMALHGGTLDLESELGVGTKAIITFPASRTLPRQDAGVGYNQAFG